MYQNTETIYNINKKKLAIDIIGGWIAFLFCVAWIIFMIYSLRIFVVRMIQEGVSMLNVIDIVMAACLILLTVVPLIYVLKYPLRRLTNCYDTFTTKVALKDCTLSYMNDRSKQSIDLSAIEAVLCYPNARMITIYVPEKDHLRELVFIRGHWGKRFIADLCERVAGNRIIKDPKEIKKFKHNNLKRLIV